MLLVTVVLFVFGVSSSALGGAASALLVAREDYYAPPVLAAVLVTLWMFHFLSCCKLALTPRGRSPAKTATASEASKKAGPPPLKKRFVLASFLAGIAASFGESVLLFLSLPKLCAFQVLSDA